MIDAFSAPVQLPDAGDRVMTSVTRRQPPCSQPRTTRTASSGLASIASGDLAQERGLDRPLDVLEVDQLRRRLGGLAVPELRRRGSRPPSASRTTTGLPARSTPMVAPVAPCTSSGLPSAPRTTAVGLR